MHSYRKMLIEIDEWKISTLSHMIENIYLLAKYKVLVQQKVHKKVFFL